MEEGDVKCVALENAKDNEFEEDKNIANYSEEQPWNHNDSEVDGKHRNICSWGDCTEVCNLKCGACQKVSYCCAEHQKKHWKLHRNDCCPYIIKQDENLGLVLVAARDLKPNVEIIREGPVLYAPVYREFTEYRNRDMESKSDISFCLTCCTQVTKSSICSKCGWPVCDTVCESQNSCHSEYECPYLTRAKVTYPVADRGLHEVYKSVFVLRCLLFRENNPIAWENIEKSYKITESSEMEQDENSDDEVHNNAQILANLMKDYGTEHLVKNLDDLKHILTLICFLTVGDSRFVPTEKEVYIWSADFIFEKILLLGNNNCFPNASWGIGFPPSFEVVIRSAIPIKKGTPISIPLNNECDLYATYLRQQHRIKGRREPCTCVRCSDPTELQTNLSSVKCFQCKKGYYTQMDPISVKSKWQCCYCEDTVECEKIFIIIDSVEKSINEAVSDENVEELENIYNRLMKYVFHPQHFLVVSLSYSILQIHMQDVFNLNDFGLERVVAHCRNILTVADIVCPGLSMIRAMVLTFQAKAMCLQLQSLTSKVGCGPQKGLMANRLLKLRQCILDALEYYRGDPNTTLPSGKNDYAEELEMIQSQLYKTVNELGFRNL